MTIQMANHTIRKGKKEDLQVLLNLIFELAEFEKAPDAVTNTVKDMERDGFGDKPAFEFFVAEIENKIVGIALYFIKYSTWKGIGIYLDDLIVTEKHRGKNIGKDLFQKVIDEAKKINAKQMHWQVLDWNTPAIEFYKKYEASVDGEWLDCKLSEEQIIKFGA
jgi:GNAT superfamily N-acetyltransferase